MNLLWLLLIPVGLFTGCSIGVGFFKLSDYFDLTDHWWHFPLWMVVGICVIVPIIAGSIVLGLGLTFGAAVI